MGAFDPGAEPDRGVTATTMSDDFDTAIAQLQRDWVGRTYQVEDVVGLSMVKRIAGMLDFDLDQFRLGTPLPPHWFTMFCAEPFRHSLIGPDGHPQKGVFLPPIPLPRRMGAGRRVRIPGELKVGDPLVKTAEVAAIIPKQGRTGRMAVLTMRHSFHRNGELMAVDEFDAVYREAVPPGTKTAATPPNPAPTNGAWSEQKLLDPPLIWRYSAVTWNAHRIHYDADYARQEEGYPGVVHNGGLTTQLVLDAAVRHGKGRLVGFNARMQRPFFAGDTVTIAGTALQDGKAMAWAQDAGGALCVPVELEFA